MAPCITGLNHTKFGMEDPLQLGTTEEGLELNSSNPKLRSNSSFTTYAAAEGAEREELHKERGISFARLWPGNVSYLQLNKKKVLKKRNLATLTVRDE